MGEKIMDALVGAVKERMGAGYTVEAREIEKNNSVWLQAVTIARTAGPVSTVVYIGRMLARIGTGEMDVQGAAGEIIRVYEDGGHDRIAGAVQHLDRGYILQNVVCQMVWGEENARRLQGMPHEDVLDLSVIYRVYLGGSSDTLTSMEVTYPLCRAYGIDEGELCARARENTKERGFLVRSVASILAEAAGLPGIGDCPIDSPIPLLWTLSTRTGLYGASVLLYGEPFDRLAERYGSDLYVIPSSIHEVLAVPVRDLEPEELRCMVAYVNASEVPAEDQLSDNVYRYSRKDKRLAIA